MNLPTFNVAIVGAGPSGFYTAEALLADELGFNINVDMYDKLPVPFGLVRYGVAPDHPKLKLTAKIFERIAQHENFNFKGNIEVGKDLSVQSLLDHYDAVVLAYGASIGRKPGIDGENLQNSYTATEFVGWYNGHPDYQSLQPDLLNARSAVIIGQGNVAIDIARILSKPVDTLSSTDITEQAVDKLRSSKLEKIHIIGRRGPAQSKFTNQELRELGELEGVDVIINDKDLIFNDTSTLELEDKKNFIVSKNIKMMQDYSERTPSTGNKQIIFHFLKNPDKLIGENNVEGIKLVKNKLVGEAFSQTAVETSSTETLPCDIVFFSIGYEGLPLEELPFNDKNSTYSHTNGKVDQMEGLYATGWIKRGATGIIGTNKPCGQETATSILNDLEKLKSSNKAGYKMIEPLLEKNPISFEQWKKIDQVELSNGVEKQKSRVKFTDVEEMLKALED